MKRRQQDAQAKAAKHCSTEKRQQEAQAMAAKHQSESLQSTRSAVSTRYNQTFVALVYSCSNIWCTHCSSNSCLYNMRTHNYPLLAYDVQALQFSSTYSSDLYPVSAYNTTQPHWQCDGQEGSIPVWHPHDGAAWEQPWGPSDLTKIPHCCKLHCFWPCCLYIYNLKWLVINMHTHVYCQYVQTLFSIAPCSMHGVLMWCNQSLGVALSTEDE